MMKVTLSIIDFLISMNCYKDNYAQDLTKCILMAEPMDTVAAEALQMLGDIIVFKQHAIDEKHIFTFEINFENKKKHDSTKNANQSLQLNIIKGSVFTYVWSTFARFDDEYSLYFCTGDDKNMLWRVKGVDALNAKIGNADVDWFQMQAVKNVMAIEGVNLLVFSKLLGRLLLSLPYFVKTGQYIAPMPASFMFNYMMAVESTPFAVSIRNLTAFLENTEKFNGRINQDLIRLLMTVNGAGMMLSGYHPYAMRNGRQCLLHSSTMMHSSQSQSSSSCSQQQGRYSVSDVSHSIFQRQYQPIHVTAGMGIDSWQYRVRTIELLEHLDGVNGLACRLECVHHTNWAANYRFLALDVYRICQAIEMQQADTTNNSTKGESCQNAENMPQIDILGLE